MGQAMLPRQDLCTLIVDVGIGSEPHCDLKPMVDIQSINIVIDSERNLWCWWLTVLAGKDPASCVVVQVFGATSAIAMFSGCIAVGTASGAIFVLMPRSINPTDGKATG